MSYTQHKHIQPIRATGFAQGTSLQKDSRLDDVDRVHITVLDESAGTEHRLLSRPVAAIPVEPDGADGARLRPVQQLKGGMKLRICGPGFNEGAALVESHEDGQLYFVFRADLNDSRMVTLHPI